MLTKVKKKLDRLQYHQKTLQVENILLSLLNNLDSLDLAALERFVEMQEINIELRDWDYTCGDGCCYDYGVELVINGESTNGEDSSYIGDNVKRALEEVLKVTGFKFKINEE